MDRIRERLDALLAETKKETQREQDPVGFVHEYHSRSDQEIVGLVAALLAFGNVVAARKSIRNVLDALGARPSDTVRSSGRNDLRRRLAGFRHRIYRGEHMAALLANAGAIQNRCGSVGEAYEEHLRDTEGDFREALARIADELRGSTRSRSLRHLVSDPRAGSACKRLLLYMRWMVRPADGVDLGLWNVPPSKLVVPVDTHIHRIATNLRFTSRRTASWAAAEEITAALRTLDPLDPVKYDFALCHLGISRECPSRPEIDKCQRCVLRDLCRVWAATEVTRSAKKAG